MSPQNFPVHTASVSFYEVVRDLGATVSAVVIGAIAAYIAYRQWQTSHEQVVLALFERRLKIYLDLRKAIALINASGQTTNQAVDEFNAARDQLPFFFGPEIEAYIADLYRAMLNHQVQSTYERERLPVDREAMSRQWQKITAFYTEFPILAAPYMRMHHKIRLGVFGCFAGLVTKAWRSIFRRGGA